MATFIDMRNDARQYREEKNYAAAVLAIAGSLRDHVKNLIRHNVDDFARMLSAYCSEAEAHYREVGGDEEDPVVVKRRVEQVDTACAAIREAVEYRPSIRVSPGTLDGLAQILQGNLESLEAYLEGKEAFVRRDLAAAAKALRRSRHAKAAGVLEEVERGRAEADRLHAEAVSRLWSRAFGEAQAALAESQRLFPRPEAQAAFEASLGRAQEADGKIREGRRQLDLYRETQDEGRLDLAVDAAAGALDMLASMGPEAASMAEDARDLDADVRVARAERAYRRYEAARRERDVAGALDALEAVAGLGFSYRDAGQRLREVRAIEAELRTAADEAARLRDARDLAGAQQCVEAALSGDFDTGALLRLREEIRGLQGRAEAAYARYEGARRERNPEDAVSALEEAAGLWAGYRDVEKRLAEVKAAQEGLERAAAQAGARFREGDLEAAAQAVQTALSGDFDTEALLSLRGEVRAQRDRAGAAYAEAREHLDGTPRRVEEALPPLRQAVDLFGRHPEYADALRDLEAEVARLSGLYEKAAAAAEQGALEAAREGYREVCGSGAAFRDAEARLRDLDEVLDRMAPEAQQALGASPADFEAALRIAQEALLRYPRYGEMRRIEREARRVKEVAETLSRARRAVAQGGDDPAPAGDALGRALELDPESREALALAEEAARGWQERAGVLAGEGQPGAAAALLDAAMQAIGGVAPLRGPAEGLEADGRAHRAQAAEARDALVEGEALVRRRAFGEARSAFERALRLDRGLEAVHPALQALPGQKRAWDAFKKGEKAEAAGDFARAYDRFLEALRGLPGDAEILAARDRTAARLGLREPFRLVSEACACTVLIGDRFDVGRNDTTDPASRHNPIAFESRGISRTHGTVYRGADGRWVMEDTNYRATDANGRPADRHVLADGDRLAIWPRRREPRPLVEIEVAACGEGAGMSVALRCSEAITALAGQGFQYVEGAEQASAYVLAGARTPVGGDERDLVRVTGAPSGCAEILWDGTCVRLRDLGDGAVRVNGEPAGDARPLRDGDRVAFGEVECRVEAVVA